LTSAGCYDLIKTDLVAGVVFDHFAPTEHVASPWGPGLQHGGPVSGLLTRALEQCASRPDARLTKITVNFLGPVPRTEMRVSARVVRPGHYIELLEASLETQLANGTWRAAATASGWRLATQPTDDVGRCADPARPFLEDGDGLGAQALPESWRKGGFVGTIEWRVGTIGRAPGEPTMVWVRLSQPLVIGEEASALASLMAVADTANGVGARLDPGLFTFLNTDVAVNLHHPPAGQWLGIEAETSIGADGVGMSAAVLHAPDGPIGSVAQTLLIDRRPERVSV
jgi:hypothetical protein